MKFRVLYLEMDQQEKKKVGLLTATSLVAGNMIGSGIFLLPATLAVYGGISLVGWLISGAGAFCLAMVYGRLSKIVTRTGGPYIYTHEAYGNFASFLASWTYWISILPTNAAIATALISYLSIFIPLLNESNLVAAVASISSIWLLTWVNARGVKSGGRMQLVTTIMKLIPLIGISVVGIFFINFDHFVPFNASQVSNTSAIGASIALTFFAFMGLESATIPAEDVKDASKVISRATILGTTLTLIVYVLSYVAILGLISPDALQKSNFPFAEGAAVIWGNAGKYIIGFGAIISTFGALNGWILLQGQIPYATSRDGLFPKAFEKLNKRGAPAGGLIISSILITILVAASYTKGLVGMFNFMVLLSTTTVVVSYLFCSLAEVLIMVRKQEPKSNLTKPLLFAVPAYIYLMWALSGVDPYVVYLGFLAMMAGIPFYIWIRKSNKHNNGDLAI